jgi:putative addiction module killer protein
MIEIRQTAVFASWHAGLEDETTRARIAQRIDRLQRGNPGDVRPVGGGVSEMRLDFGPGYRLYYTRRGKALIVLLCGGDKSTQKKDVRTAKAMARELKG